MPTPQDILIPIPENEVPAFRKPRWHFLGINNPYQNIGTMNCMAEELELSATEDVIKGPVREGKYDFTITFDPNNPLHVQLYELLDQVVKEGWAAEVARRAAIAAPAP